jgi:hypothetical protein
MLHVWIFNGALPYKRRLANTLLERLLLPLRDLSTLTPAFTTPFTSALRSPFFFRCLNQYCDDRLVQGSEILRL